MGGLGEGGGIESEYMLKRRVCGQSEDTARDS
jgi:hypothetical protein